MENPAKYSAPYVSFGITDLFKELLPCIAQLFSFARKTMLAMSAWSIMGGCEASLPTIRDGGTQSNSYSKGRGTVLARCLSSPATPRQLLQVLPWHEKHTTERLGAAQREGKGDYFSPNTAITPRLQSFQPHRGVQAPGKHKSFGVCNSSMKTTNYSLYYTRKPKRVKSCVVEQ